MGTTRMTVLYDNVSLFSGAPVSEASCGGLSREGSVSMGAAKNFHACPQGYVNQIRVLGQSRLGCSTGYSGQSDRINYVIAARLSSVSAVISLERGPSTEPTDDVLSMTLVNAIRWITPKGHRFRCLGGFLAGQTPTRHTSRCGEPTILLPDGIRTVIQFVCGGAEMPNRGNPIAWLANRGPRASSVPPSCRSGHVCRWRPNPSVGCHGSRAVSEDSP